MRVAISLIDGAIVPADERSVRLMKKLQPGEAYDCLIDGERVRSNPQNARYWAQIHKLASVIPEPFQAAFARNMLDSLTLEQIDESTLHEYIKMRAGVSSISFDKMNHAQACEFYRVADEEIEKLTAIAKATLEVMW